MFVYLHFSHNEQQLVSRTKDGDTWKDFLIKAIRISNETKWWPSLKQMNNQSNVVESSRLYAIMIIFTVMLMICKQRNNPLMLVNS